MKGLFVFNPFNVYDIPIIPVDEVNNLFFVLCIVFAVICFSTRTPGLPSEQPQRISLLSLKETLMNRRLRNASFSLKTCDKKIKRFFG